jgi:DNA-binding NarL/FixJ family response regulator
MPESNMISVAIIDDSTIIRYSINHLLTSNGIPVIFEADNGQMCLEEMSRRTQLPGIIILDLEMPVMNGFDTAVALKKKWPDVHIIAFSGRDDHHNVNKSLLAGADQFFSKHRDPIELLELIQIMNKRILPG